MSLLVHELLIGTGGGGSNASNIQTSSSNPVPIASVTVTHSNPNLQVAHIQQSRVVTITSSQSRLPTPEKGSRLAEALAGNTPYPYPSASQRLPRSQASNRHIVSHVFTTSGIPSSQPDSLKSSKPISSRQTYVLPFVLQDHNYGAPPPPTPPHSPPPPHPSPVVTSSSVPYSYKVHQIFPSTTTTTTSKTSPRCNTTQCISQSKIQSQFPKVTPEQSVLTIKNVGAVQIANSSTASGDTTNNHSVASHIMATMPLHRQQFMPHPKVNVYSSPSVNAPGSSSEPISPKSVPPPPPPTAGQDTDEESRLSDRSSSVGPSGEETETAPEGEGEEQVQADDSITRCICNFTHDDGYMIQCDRCFVWQHVDCMEIDRNNIPDEYLCEACKPRVTDKSKARALQVRRRQEIRAHLARVSSSDSEDNNGPPLRSKSSSGKSQDRKVLKKKKPKSSKENKSSRKHSFSSGKNSFGNSSSNNLKTAQCQDDREGKSSLVKARRRQSSLSGGHSTGDESPASTTLSLEQLRSWIEDYEVAVTNHYSPELRAKVHAARINGISQEFRESTQGALLGHRCRVAPCYDAGPQSFEEKILVAATRLEMGTAIIEYQGKYTLKSQWNSLLLPPHLPYLPFVLQYNMQKEGLQVCVDARTYGNDARFARRSLNCNAEIRHVVERGSVHLYIVASRNIEEEEEITLPLETALCQQSSYKSPTRIPNKVDGIENLKEESSKILNTISQIRKNGILQNNKKNLRKPLLSLSLPQPLNRTSRRATSSDSYNCDDVNSPIQAVSPMKQRRASGCGGSRSPAKCNIKSPSKSPTKTNIEDSSSGESPHHESPGSGDKDSHKMTREERKIAAYMKAFERLEKAAQRKQEMEKKKGEDKGRRHIHGDDEEAKGSGSMDESTPKNLFERRKCKKSLKGSPHKSSNDLSEDDNYGSSSEGEKTKCFEGSGPGYISPPVSGFKFPKTKKSLMNEWLNETIDPVLHSSSFGGEMATGVPTCYMRSPSTTPMRKAGVPPPSCVSVKTGVIEMAGRSAKKRWLRQAIIDETEPPIHSGTLNTCSSPNSRPDSPVSYDYITPLKKRRLARESMSSEQSNTPPSTPLHSGLEEKFNEEMELDHASDENFDVEEDKGKMEIKEENKVRVNDIKEEPCSHSDLNDGRESKPDRLTINISQINVEVKSEPQESDSETKDKFNSLNSIKCESDLLKYESEDKMENCEVDKCEAKIDNLKNDKSHHSIKTNESEEKMVQKQVKTPSKSSKSSVKKVHKNKKKDKILKYINLDKNRNMQRKKILTSPKKKRKKSKPNKLKSKKGSSKSKNKKEESKVKLKTVDEKFMKDESIKNNLKEKFSTFDNSLSNIQRQGPKTPEGTPPETPVKLENQMKSPNNSGEASQCGFGKNFQSNLKNSVDEGKYSTSSLHFTQPLENSALLSDKGIGESETMKDLSKVEENVQCNEATKSESSHSLQISDVWKDRDEAAAKGDTVVDDINTGNKDTAGKSDEKSQPLTADTSFKPAAVKRKLSILEYRKRKSISCEREQKEDTSSNIPNPSSSEIFLENIPQSEHCEDNNKGSNMLDSSQTIDPSTTTSEPSRIFPSLSQNLLLDTGVKMEKGKCESGTALSPLKGNNKDVKWNAAPTLLEQQRENLTARLRREFGLCLPEENQLKLKLGDQSMKNKWSELEKKYGFSGKKLLTSTHSSSYSGPQMPSLPAFKSPPPTRLPGLGSNAECRSPSQKNESRTFYAPDIKPSVPLPPTFEKLNSVKLGADCDANNKVVGNDAAHSVKLKMQPSLRSPTDVHTRVRCEIDKKLDS